MLKRAVQSGAGGGLGALRPEIPANLPIMVALATMTSTPHSPHPSDPSGPSLAKVGRGWQQRWWRGGDRGGGGPPVLKGLTVVESPGVVFIHSTRVHGGAAGAGGHGSHLKWPMLRGMTSPLSQAFLWGSASAACQRRVSGDELVLHRTTRHVSSLYRNE